VVIPFPQRQGSRRRYSSLCAPQWDVPLGRVWDPRPGVGVPREAHGPCHRPNGFASLLFEERARHPQVAWALSPHEHRNTSPSVSSCSPHAGVGCGGFYPYLGGDTVDAITWNSQRSRSAWVATKWCRLDPRLKGDAAARYVSRSIPESGSSGVDTKPTTTLVVTASQAVAKRREESRGVGEQPVASQTRSVSWTLCHHSPASASNFTGHDRRARPGGQQPWARLPSPVVRRDYTPCENESRHSAAIGHWW
jgi:hypothetical protein